MSKATEQSANEVAVLLEERFCKYIPKSSKSLAAINKKYRKIPFDENNIPLTFIKTFCGIEKLCHYRFLFNSKDGILNNLMKESKNNTSPTDYTQTSIELSNAIHFMSQSNEKLLSKFPFFRHCLNSQNLRIHWSPKFYIFYWNFYLQEVEDGVDDVEDGHRIM